MKKSQNWGLAEMEVLVNKAIEFIDTIQMTGRDARTLERKRFSWEHIANFVNEVNETGKFINTCIYIILL